MGIRGATVNDVRDDGTLAEEADGHGSRRTRSDGDPKTAEGSAVNGVLPVVPAAGDGSDSDSVAPPPRPVFVDATGKRSRTWRRTGVITALCCACYATTVAAALVGGDSGAPYLQLPRAMGLEREAGEQSTRSQDGDRAAAAAGSKPETPRPVASGPVAFDASARSAPARVSAARPLEASSDPVGIPEVVARTVVPTSGPRSSAPASGTSGGSAQSGEGSTDEPSSPAPEDGNGSGGGGATAGGDDTQGGEAEGTAPPEGPLGDLLGGLLGGLLGSV
ncbi:hypothetical protein ACFWFI_16210 [Streptomyces sp. NPDC060209]|uniref:hypothetical protein n=1 Tax=Streptomyces sp. NPDC060209 TaxID=3347073 RepID=UPI00365F4D88